MSRIPLATWFRYRAAAERTQACVILLTQYPCAKSSAELVLRMEKGVIRTQGGRVMTGFERRVEVVGQEDLDEVDLVDGQQVLGAGEGPRLRHPPRPRLPRRDGGIGVADSHDRGPRVPQVLDRVQVRDPAGADEADPEFVHPGPPSGTSRFGLPGERTVGDAWSAADQDPAPLTLSACPGTGPSTWTVASGCSLDSCWAASAVR